MKAIFKSIRENIGWYFLMLLVVAVILLLICVIESVYHSFLYALIYLLSNVKLLFALCLLILSLLISLLIMLLATKFGNAFRTIIYTRFMCIVKILFIVCLLCYVYNHALIIQFQHTDLDITATDKMPIEFLGGIVMVIVGNIGTLGLILYLVYLFFKQFKFLIYTPDILFLRTFSFDNKYQYIEHKIKSIAVNRDVLTIGNPKTIFRKTLGKTLYLPSVNWKKWLDYYILKSTNVILVVDNSKGVLWEMFEHIEHINKYIFIVPDKSLLKEILNNSSVSIEKNNVLQKYLHDVIEKSTDEQFVFSIQNGSIKISSIKKLETHILHRTKKVACDNSLENAATRRYDQLARMRENIISVIQNVGFFFGDVLEFLVGIYEDISYFFSKKWFYVLMGILCVTLGIFVIIMMFIDRGTIAQYIFSIILGGGTIALGVGMIISKLKE